MLIVASLLVSYLVASYGVEKIWKWSARRYVAVDPGLSYTLLHFLFIDLVAMVLLLRSIHWQPSRFCIALGSLLAGRIIYAIIARGSVRGNLRQLAIVPFAVATTLFVILPIIFLGAKRDH